MPAAPDPSGGRKAGGEAAIRFVAGGLALAAAPVFAAMAGLCAADPAASMPCAAGGSPLNGMATMYALMALFHAGAWLRLARRRPDPS